MRILFKYTTDDDWVHQIRATAGANVESVHINSDETMVIMDNGEMYVFETRAGDVEWDDLDENPNFEEEEDLTLEQVVKFLNDYECFDSFQQAYVSAAVSNLRYAMESEQKSDPPFPRHSGGHITHTDTANGVAHNHVDSKLTHDSLLTKVINGT